MRLLLILILCIAVWEVKAQEGFLYQKDKSFNLMASSVYPIDNSFNLHDLNLPEKVNIIYLNSPDGYFQRSWMLDGKSEVVSTGFMPAVFFIPNRNFLVVSGKNIKGRDSFNPYGADDMPTALFFGAFNNFLSRFRWNKR